MELPPAPEILYHYTNSVGLVSILKDHRFYASEYHHLNDLGEIKEGWRIATEIHSRFVGELVDRFGPQEWMPSSVLEGIRALDSTHKDDWLKENNVYVASFSEDQDSLPQWRSYADDGRGFAIGVATAELTKRTIADGFILLRCIYGQASLQDHDSVFGQRIAPILVKILQPLKEASPTDSTVEDSLRYIRNLGTALETVRRAWAASYKSEAFSSEKEWRYVHGLYTRVPDDALEFRPSRLGATPFIYFPANKTDFTRIVVGPCTDKEGAEFGIKQLLKCKNLTCSVDFSKASYRGS